MSSGRMHRVDTAVRHVLGEALAGELKDPRVGFVTVTDVRTSPDLRHARVYVSVLDTGASSSSSSSSQDEREATLEGLRSAHGYLQSRIATELRLKRTPTLEFVYDDTTDRAMRLEELLAQDEDKDGDEGEDKDDDSKDKDGDL
jgi:ribosome-binding factor A